MLNKLLDYLTISVFLLFFLLFHKSLILCEVGHEHRYCTL